MKQKNLREQLNRERKIKSLTSTAVLLLILSFVTYSFFFGNMGYLKYRELRHNEQKLIKEINELTAANQALREEIRLLRTDPNYLEKFAKEKFGLVKPGELIFQFRDSER